MKQFLTELRTAAWRTAGARYNAARRLKQREWLSTCSLALLSALSIAVAFAQKVYAPTAGNPLDNYLTSLAVGLGVLLLVISLLEWGAGYGAKSETLHRNAELLTAYQLKLAQRIAAMDSGVVFDSESIDALRLEYEAVKDNCSANHLPRDDALFRAHHRRAKEFAAANGDPLIGALSAFGTRVAWRLSEVWFFAAIWALALGSLAYAFTFLRP